VHAGGGQGLLQGSERRLSGILHPVDEDHVGVQLEEGVTQIRRSTVSFRVVAEHVHLDNEVPGKNKEQLKGVVDLLLVLFVER
jgi:hypothetical protein